MNPNLLVMCERDTPCALFLFFPKLLRPPTLLRVLLEDTEEESLEDDDNDEDEAERGVVLTQTSSCSRFEM